MLETAISAWYSTGEDSVKDVLFDIIAYDKDNNRKHDVTDEQVDEAIAEFLKSHGKFIEYAQSQMNTFIIQLIGAYTKGEQAGITQATAIIDAANKTK